MNHLLLTTVLLIRRYLPAFTACALFLVFTDLVADHAANRRAADSADSAAAREYCTAYGTNAGADGSALVTVRHPGTTAQAEQRGDHQCTDCNSFRVFHCIYLF
jgi:hypothetical protein